MTSVIDAQKEEMSKLQKDNQSLQRSNDDLRNNAGILTRDKVRAILNCNDELQEKYDRMTSETANLRRQVDMSSVRAVEEAGRCQQEAERRRLEALTLAQKERKAKQEAILRVEAERAELTRERLASQRRENLSYGLVTAFLFASSTYHPVIWTDLRRLLEPAADWIAQIWIGALLQPEGFSPVVRWLCLLLLPALVCAVGVGLYWLLNLLWDQKNTLTTILTAICLAGIIFFGEYYPGNAALLLMETVSMISLSKYLYDRHRKTRALEAQETPNGLTDHRGF